jgi:hypothetical protein
MRITSLLPLTLLAMLGACAASIPPVEVTRFHLGQPVPAGSVRFAAPASMEAAAYNAAVLQALTRIGFTEVGGGPPAVYTAITNFTRTSREQEKRSPVSVGIGGGTGGGGFGVGVGTTIGLGSSTREIIVIRLSVQMVRVADATVMWEGRAQTEAPAKAPAAAPGLAAKKLADALFAGFPGESGKTILVP